MKKIMLCLLMASTQTYAKELKIILEKLPSSHSNTTCVSVFSLDGDTHGFISLKFANPDMRKNAQTNVTSSEKIVCIDAPELNFNADDSINAEIRSTGSIAKPAIDEYQLSVVKGFKEYLPIDCGEKVLINGQISQVEVKTVNGTYKMTDGQMFKRGALESLKVDRFNGIEKGHSVMLKENGQILEVLQVSEKGNLILSNDLIVTGDQVERVSC